MVVGPWTHYSMPKHIGVHNDQPIDDLLIGWFDYWLKGIDNGVTRLDPVLLWENGSERWVGHDDWPGETSHQRLHLSAARSGTSRSVNDGSMSTSTAVTPGRDTTVVDPTNGLCSRQTVQFLGGLPVYLPITFFMPSFPLTEVPNIDQIAPCFRRDDRDNEFGVLTYTSPPVVEAIAFSGPIALTLWGSTTAEDPSWVARLSDVAPDGTARPISQGALVASRRQLDPVRTRYAPNGDVIEPFHLHTQAASLPVRRDSEERYHVEIWPTSWQLAPGHRLRLTIDGAELPHLLPTFEAPKRLGTLTAHTAPGQLSFLSIPLLSGSF